ncbi:hypothetical protein [Nocardia rhizosphaerae]|uniref:SPOR domain-containing protein n=1 Tax=Nocardia rhizosphaerae TaxID=1691571 RepID=A0ABV8L2I0_9NOCA
MSAPTIEQARAMFRVHGSGSGFRVQQRCGRWETLGSPYATAEEAQAAAERYAESYVAHFADGGI